MFEDYTKAGLLLLFSCSFGGLLAQETISPSGGNANGSGGIASYTIGQLADSQNVGVNGVSSEGVQQPYEISVITSNNNAEFSELDLSIYPNPSVDELTLSCGELNLVNASYKLFNEQGVSLKEQMITTSTTHIDISDLSQAHYLLKIIDENKVLKTFKIIKL